MDARRFPIEPQDGESENPPDAESADALLTSAKALSFGDFSLCQQRKVTRPQGGSSVLQAKSKSLDPCLDDERKSHWITAFAEMTSKDNVRNDDPAYVQPNASNNLSIP